MCLMLPFQVPVVPVGVRVMFLDDFGDLPSHFFAGRLSVVWDVDNELRLLVVFVFALLGCVARVPLLSLCRNRGRGGPPKTPPTKRRRYTRKEKSEFKREEASRRKGENITPPDKRRKNNSPPTPHANGSTTRKTNTPYQGPYRIVTWNAQGLLAHDIDAQQLRRQHMLQLCSNTDILCMQETHTTITAVEAWEHPEDFTPFWSHDTRQRAGVVTLIRNEFLKNFNPVLLKDIDHIVQGRLMGINLRHPTMGNLYVINAYLQSGSDRQKDRTQAISELTRKIPAHNKQTTILTGDFNFAEHTEDRYCQNKGEHTGHRDNHEAQLFKHILLTPHHLTLVHQPHYTHKTLHSTSTLDRFYLSHHLLDQVDFAFHCTAMEWTKHSNHRPVRLTKTPRSPTEHATIPPHHLTKPEWKDRLYWTFTGKLHKHKKDNKKKKVHPMIQLRLYKETMWDFSRKMSEEDRTKGNITPSNPKNEDELLGHMSSAIRNLTRHPTNDPPKWTTINYEHPLTEEWNQGLGTRVRW